MHVDAPVEHEPREDGGASRDDLNYNLQVHFILFDLHAHAK